MSKFTPTPAEVALVNQIFTQADTQKLGVITGDAAVKIFNGPKLPPSMLAEIWNLADEDNNGVLTRKGVAVAIRLLGHAQRGEKITEASVLQRECSCAVSVTRLTTRCFSWPYSDHRRLDSSTRPAIYRYSSRALPAPRAPTLDTSGQDQVHETVPLMRSD